MVSVSFKLRIIFSLVCILSLFAALMISVSASTYTDKLDRSAGPYNVGKVNYPTYTNTNSRSNTGSYNAPVENQNALVTKYVVEYGSEFDNLPRYPVYPEVNTNQVYMKYNTLENLKQGYSMSKNLTIRPKKCATVRGYYGPSTVGFMTAVRRTDC